MMRKTFILGLISFLLFYLVACAPIHKASHLKVKSSIPLASLHDHYWESSRQEVDRSVPEILAQHRRELERNLRFIYFIHGNTQKREIALTFDDGPHPIFTPKILAILKRYNVKATFFVVGEMAEKYPELIRAEVADGHILGDHTYSHINLTKIPQELVATEIDACGDVLENITGVRPNLFRPPGGDYNDKVALTAETLKYIMVLWTDNAGDWCSPGKLEIEDKVFPNLSNGGIILMHDGIAQTDSILPKIILGIQKRGFKFVTLQEMLRGI
jgi:peptidoglycan/xylan/chitin deacetylase (PgdA/CDA1 family)